MRLPDLVTELLDLANGAAPTAATIRAALAGRDLSPVVHTVNIRDDARGWGTYAELVIHAEARVRELVAVVGELRPAPRSPGDSLSGAKLAAELTRGSQRLRVSVELAPRSADRILYVTIQYKREP